MRVLFIRAVEAEACTAAVREIAAAGGRHFWATWHLARTHPRKTVNTMGYVRVPILLITIVLRVVAVALRGGW